MRPRREKLLLGISLASFAGVAVLFATILWFLYRESVAAEERFVGELAATLGVRAEKMILDTQHMLEEFERLPSPRCSVAHIRALQDVAMSRPYIRAIGYWRAAERRCGVGFLQVAPLRPPRADSIYRSGVIAWWPSAQTEVGGVRLFLMRFGDHDAAIDPSALLEISSLEGRRAGLWVEKRLLASQPESVTLISPDSIPEGLTLDRVNQLAISRHSRPGELPIDIVVTEELKSFWGRYSRTIALGTGVGLFLVGIFGYGTLRYVRHRLSMGTLLRHAIGRGWITARYQPVIELRTGRIAGAEALARWKLKGGEEVPPDVFIPLAEREGICPEITRTILALTLRDLHRLLRAKPQLSININLSAQDLSSDLFLRSLENVLQAKELPAKAIKLEITERSLANTEVARGLIRRLREMGHETAVDDFGTGYSSLSYLSSFELDWLKIDKSFVDAIGTEAATSHVIVHVIEMARSLGLRVVAEGVETEAQVQWLIEHGVEMGQGYFFSAPLTAEAFAAFCERDAA